MGTKNDNSSNLQFIYDLENAFGSPLSVLDLGSVGGLFVHDLIRRGHNAIGLERSDYNVITHRAEWPALYQKNLFTCDVGREFRVYTEEKGMKKQFLCDVITAWEVIEHIPLERMGQFFENGRQHLRLGGYLFGSVNVTSCTENNITYHQSTHSKKNGMKPSCRK